MRLASVALVAAERVVGTAIGLYCRAAAQRRPFDLPRLASVGERGTVVLLRCFSQVPFGGRFKEVFQEAGYQVHECELRRRLIGVTETIAEVIESLIAHPPPGKIEIVVGASAGGIADTVLAALAKATPEARVLLISKLDYILPKTPHRTVQALNDLADRLQGARFVPIFSPINGEEFHRPFDWIVRGIDRLRPGLFSGFRRQALRGVDPRSKEGLYQYLDFEPSEVVDGIVIGGAQTWGLHADDAASLAANALMQGVGRVTSRLVLRRAPGEITDGVIGHRSALLELAPHRFRIVPKANHIDGMEIPETAEAVLELVHLG